MGLLIIHHRVRDYDAWRPAYDAHKPMRNSAGLTNGRVFRATDNSNDLVILLDMADRQKAQDFVASDDLKTVMRNAGVEGTPEIHYVG
jgi:hypothetical protein